MLLNNKEFDVAPEKMDKFFSVMDTFEKVVLSKNLEEEPLREDDRKHYCIYIVSNHAIGLPTAAKKLLEPYIKYTE